MKANTFRFNELEQTQHGIKSYCQHGLYDFLLNVEMYVQAIIPIFW